MASATSKPWTSVQEAPAPPMASRSRPAGHVDAADGAPAPAAPSYRPWPPARCHGCSVRLRSFGSGVEPAAGHHPALPAAPARRPASAGRGVRDPRQAGRHGYRLYRKAGSPASRCGTARTTCTGCWRREGVRPTRPERGGGGQRVCPFRVDGPCPAARPGCGERQEGNGRREVARLLERENALKGETPRTLPA
jgi:hypothetical protein